MAESTLSIDYDELREAIAVRSGYGRTSGNWTSAQAADINDVLTTTPQPDGNLEIVGRLKVLRASDEARMEKMGISDPNRVYKTEDLAPGKSILFSATGVTSGDLLGGVRFFGDGCRTHSLVMSSKPRGVRFIDTIHVREGDDVKIRF